MTDYVDIVYGVLSSFNMLYSHCARWKNSQPVSSLSSTLYCCLNLVTFNTVVLHHVTENTLVNV